MRVVRQPEHLYGIFAIIMKAGTKAALAFAVSMTLFLNTAHASGLVTFTSPNPQASGSFGTSVAISGPIVVVGAPQETGGGYSSAGHAYITDTTKPLTITLTSPNAESSGTFGQSVAISGSTVVVGAPGETEGGQPGAGHAYVFDASAGSLISTLTSPNAEAGGAFGYSVAISGSTVVVGAPGETEGGQPGAGNAYVFDSSTGFLTSTLTSANAEANGLFGQSVAILDTTSGTIVGVGAPGETVGGHAYIFDASTGSLITTLMSPNAETDGSFGFAFTFDFTPPRITVGVGAPGETEGGQPRAGHAYIFDVTSDSVTTLTSPNTEAGGFFAYSLSIAGTTVGVGAPGETVGGQKDAGRAYTFDSTTGLVIDTFASPYAQEGGRFGYDLVVTEFRDENGDLVGVLITGAPGETADGQAGAGHAYLSNTAP